MMQSLHDSIMNSPEIMEIKNKINECDNQIQYLEKIKESHEDDISRIFEAQYNEQEKIMVTV